MEGYQGGRSADSLGLFPGTKEILTQWRYDWAPCYPGLIGSAMVLRLQPRCHRYHLAWMAPLVSCYLDSPLDEGALTIPVTTRRGAQEQCPDCNRNE